MVITNPYECMGNLGMVFTSRLVTYMILLMVTQSSCLVVLPLAAMAGSSTDRAFEPIVGERSVGEKCMATTVISFNFGMPQQMLDPVPWNNRHRRKFLELLRIFGDDYHADMIFGCEIGGTDRGPGRTTGGA